MCDSGGIQRTEAGAGVSGRARASGCVSCYKDISVSSCFLQPFHGIENYAAWHVLAPTDARLQARRVLQGNGEFAVGHLCI